MMLNRTSLAAFLIIASIGLSTVAMADSYYKDKYDHAWVLEPDRFGLSLKGYSYEMTQAAIDQKEYMQNVPIAPNPPKRRQFWRNLVNNTPVEPVERFGTDVIDVQNYEKSHYGVKYPYQNYADSLKDDPHTQYQENYRPRR